MEQHRGVQCLPEFGCDSDVITVTVGTDDSVDVPAGDRIDDWLRGVCGVDHDHVGVDS